MNGDDRPLLVLQVTGDEGERLTLRWRFDHQPLGLGYQISRAFLENRATTVRTRLAQLLGAVRTDYQRCGTELKALAVAGRELYLAMFRPVPIGNEWPGLIRTEVESLPAERRCQVEISENVHIPWGLVYDADPQALPDDPAVCDATTYRNFWSVKHSLATIYVNAVLPPGVRFPIESQRFLLLTFLNMGDLEEAWDKVPPNEKPARDQFLNAPRIDRKSFLAAAQELENNHSLLYFLCHANGSKLALGASDTIALDDFEFIKPYRIDHKTACLLFLNGCETAVGAAGGGFLSATCRPGFYGFIGTETKVPDLYAMRFGVEFFRDFLGHGLPLYRVMDALRAQHWPLSLLYSLYAYPQICVTPVGQEPVPPAVGANFCAPPVGSGDL